MSSSSYLAALKLNTHAMRALTSLAFGVLLLYVSIASFITSSFTGSGKPISLSVGFVALVAGSAFGILAYLQWRKPAVYTSV